MFKDLLGKTFTLLRTHPPTYLRACVPACLRISSMRISCAFPPCAPASFPPFHFLPSLSFSLKRYIYLHMNVHHSSLVARCIGNHSIMNSPSQCEPLQLLPALREYSFYIHHKGTSSDLVGKPLLGPAVLEKS